VNLETAIAKAKQFYDKEQRNAANVAVAVTHWGYGSDSSNGAQTIAALTSFGLLQDDGMGEKRTVKLTQNALRILLDTRPDSKERSELIKQAALAPKIHQELWKKWGTGLPSDAQLRHTLLFEWPTPFNENAVDYFIREYRATVGFAKLLDSDKVALGGEDTNGEGKPNVKIGDFIQWESQGQIQFVEPRRVIGFSDDGQYLFIEGTNTGIPVVEATVEEAPKTLVARTVNMPVEILGSVGTSAHRVMQGARSGGRANMRQDVFSVEEGEVVLSWPVSLSQESIEEVKDWLKILERKIARSLVTNDKQKPASSGGEE
jgi:hypothetical protein